MATVRADTAAEFTRVVAYLEELLALAAVDADRVAAFHRAAGHAWLGVASMDESRDQRHRGDRRDGCDPHGS